MPAYTRGQTRPNLKFASVSIAMSFGFKPKDIAAITGISAADVAALGHLAPDAVPDGIIKVVGANSPKPPRVTKKIAAESTAAQAPASSYCAYTAIAAAQALGWSLTKGRKGVSLRAAGNGDTGPRTITAIATLSDGSLYAFPMNRADFVLFGASLGLERSSIITTDAERAKLVSGSTYPYPGKAAKRLDDGSTFSSFFSTSAQSSAATAGFDILSEEKVYA
ncbi:hypothetical protein [Nodularia sphaerocarpa]|uniref:hypothetical protein n=1 Tax=Nodularia sphaerocarpa TaxID=137816 RepID=UPI001EFB64D4|nr:hypothetical protein [Nodularia sphaerocarpa]MDB9375754.1 hypothetical protein [Nodularia sphaerocarpa CS-585]MDB9377232.1 hypothetical protein [Nodularia sphaerocarpa CS-585A2]ULP73103.1 hypothetical protein BDGGKGIB_02756 [Nodularia sphaerocarpa UHCC 0038]